MMIRFGHIAIKTHRLEEMKSFYTRALGGEALPLWRSKEDGITICYILFPHGLIELIEMGGVLPRENPQVIREGLSHFSFIVGSVEEVDQMFEDVLKAGTAKVNARPQVYGGEFYEGSVFDPDGNVVEIGCPPEFLKSALEQQ